MLNNTTVLTFKAISDFIKDLAELFLDQHRPLKLYFHLIEQMTLSHEAPILKHCEAFKKFCVANRDALMQKKVGKILEPIVSYSKRVYINIETIFKHADQETQVAIWNHLLTISALVDPETKAKQILKLKVTPESGNESDFVTNIMNRVVNNIETDAKPGDVIKSMLSSGVLSDIVTEMSDNLENGNLDIGKMLGTVTGMMSGMTGGDDTETKQLSGMVSGVMAMVGNLQGGKQPGTGDITQLLGNMMSTQKPEKIKEEIDEEFKKSKNLAIADID